MRKTDKDTAGLKGLAIVCIMACAVLCGFYEEEFFLGPEDMETFREMQQYLEEERKELNGQCQGQEDRDTSPTSQTDFQERQRRNRKRKRASGVGESGRQKQWKEGVSKDIAKWATAENLHRVIAVSNTVLHDLKAKHLADLDGETGCKTGSLEWIGSIKEILEAALEDFAGRRGGEETEKIVELIGKAVKGYAEELEIRRASLEEAAKEWIPKYIFTLDALLKHGESLAKVLRGEEDADLTKEVVTKTHSIPPNTYDMLFTVVQKGLEDLAGDRPIGDIRRNNTALCNINKVREWRAVKGKGKKRGNVTHSLNHVKNTFFFMPLSLTHYDATKQARHTVTRREENGEALQCFYPVSRALQERLESVYSRVDAFLDALQFQVGKEEETERLREKGERLREKAVATMKEVEVMGDVYGHVREYYGRYENARELCQTLPMEAIESCLREEEEREGGSVAALLEILFRAMERTEHYENMARETRNEANGSLGTNNYKYNLVKQWLTSLSQSTCEMEEWMALLSRFDVSAPYWVS